MSNSLERCARVRTPRFYATERRPVSSHRFRPTRNVIRPVREHRRAPAPRSSLGFRLDAKAVASRRLVLPRARRRPRAPDLEPASRALGYRAVRLHTRATRATTGAALRGRRRAVFGSRDPRLPDEVLAHARPDDVCASRALRGAQPQSLELGGGGGLRGLAAARLRRVRATARLIRLRLHRAAHERYKRHASPACPR